MNRKNVRKLVDEIKDVYDNPYTRIHREYLKRRRIPYVPRSKRHPSYFKFTDYLKFTESRRSQIINALEGEHNA